LAKDVVMPALGMAQETGTLLKWLKTPGESVAKGEPLMEIETDKATVEVEAPASGILSNVTAQPGDVIPVGQVIASIVAAGEVAPKETPAKAAAAPAAAGTVAVNASPIARRVAAEHNLDLAQVIPQGGRVQKRDVLAYLASQEKLSATSPISSTLGRELVLASPKARRLARERGIDLQAIRGSGPDGAVLAVDVIMADVLKAPPGTPVASGVRAKDNGDASVALPDTTSETMTVSRLWQIMAQRVSQAWTTIPHFYLLREVNATRLIAWLGEARGRAVVKSEKVTYTDLLVKLTAAALRQHPRLNASWLKDTIVLNGEINIGLAVAVDDGLVVPVIHNADKHGLSQLAVRRVELVAKAQAGKLSPDDIGGGTFTISNLGMYGVDAFNAIVNPPQAAILAVSRIADRVVPLNGQPAVQPMINLSLSCDHRVVDGARGAQFLQTLAALMEDPLRLLD
jgi:pyruvate dehydrogenase E2 component (dihydrolipoamide acetyltransferase)